LEPETQIDYGLLFDMFDSFMKLYLIYFYKDPEFIALQNLSAVFRNLLKYHLPKLNKMLKLGPETYFN